MDTDEHRLGGEHVDVASNHGLIEFKFFYRTSISGSASAAVFGFVLFILGVYIASLVPWTETRGQMVAFAVILIGIAVFWSGVRRILPYASNPESAIQRITLHEAGVALGTSMLLPEVVFIPYTEIQRLELRGEKNRFVLIIVHTHGKVFLKETAFTNKKYFVRMLDELETRTSVTLKKSFLQFQFTLSTLLAVMTLVAIYLAFLKHTASDNDVFKEYVVLSLFIAIILGDAALFNFLLQYTTSGRVFIICFTLGFIVECTAMELLWDVNLIVYPITRALRKILVSGVDLRYTYSLIIPVLLSGPLLSGTFFGIVGVIVSRLRRRSVAQYRNQK